MKYKIFTSTDQNVSKFVFESDDSCTKLKPIAVETVLYRYPTYRERTVICCSVQCGCKVGCKFCGTGKFFVRSLTASEITEQVYVALSTIDCKTEEINKFQIMFMSMGEPFLNYVQLQKAIKILHVKYPNAQLLVSTSAPFNYTQPYDDALSHWMEFKHLSQKIDKVGIQFSVHESTDANRRKLIPTNTSSLDLIATMGTDWAHETGRRPFFNYCVHKGNDTEDDVHRLVKVFNPQIWQCTLSVICSKDQSMKAAIDSQLHMINTFNNLMVGAGYSTRIFNPAGQDDIGGGCGQLWYFQEWLHKNQCKNG